MQHCTVALATSKHSGNGFGFGSGPEHKTGAGVVWERAEDMCLESCSHPGLSCSSLFIDPFPFDADVKTHRYNQEKSDPATQILQKYLGLKKREGTVIFLE